MEKYEAVDVKRSSISIKIIYKLRLAYRLLFGSSDFFFDLCPCKGCRVIDPRNIAHERPDWKIETDAPRFLFSFPFFVPVLVLSKVWKSIHRFSESFNIYA